jgi:hypothetical protein
MKKRGHVPLIDKVLRFFGLSRNLPSDNASSYGGERYDRTTNTVSLTKNEVDFVDMIGVNALVMYDLCRADPDRVSVMEKHYGPPNSPNEEESRQRFARHVIAYMESSGSKRDADAISRDIAASIQHSGKMIEGDHPHPEIVKILESVYGVRDEETQRFLARLEERSRNE